MKKGFILVFVLWIMTFLLILSVALARVASQSLVPARIFKERLIAHSFGQAVLRQAQAIIRVDETEDYDTLYELMGGLEDREIIFDEGSASYKLGDEQGKININFALWDDWNNLIKIDDTEEKQELISHIFSYEDRPFECKEEMLAVEGMTVEIYNCIKDLITVFGPPSMNINTITEEQMLANGFRENLIDAIIVYRQGNDYIEGTEDDGIFESTSEIYDQLVTKGNLEHEDIEQLEDLIVDKLVVASNNFCLEAKMYSKGEKEIGSLEAVFGRDDQILRWKEN